MEGEGRREPGYSREPSYSRDLFVSFLLATATEQSSAEPTWMKATVTTMSTAWGQRAVTAVGTEGQGWGQDWDHHHRDKGLVTTYMGMGDR